MKTTLLAILLVIGINAFGQSDTMYLKVSRMQYEYSLQELRTKMNLLEQTIDFNSELHHRAGKNIIISYICGITGSVLLSKAFVNKSLRDGQKPSSPNRNVYNNNYQSSLVIGCAFSGVSAYTLIKSFIQHYFLQSNNKPKLPNQSEYVN